MPVSEDSLKIAVLIDFDNIEIGNLDESLAWSTDGALVFYTIRDETNRSHKVWRCRFSLN